MGRHPYPLPRTENDNTFCHVGETATQLDGSLHSKKLSTVDNPWGRLYTTQTLASDRQSVHHYDPKAPRDSLDFVIKASYDHHNKFMADNNETLLQHETLGGNHGRILKNRKKKIDPVERAERAKPKFTESDMLPRMTTHSVKMAIESHHIPLTNPGYSRKHDGGFYTT